MNPCRGPKRCLPLQLAPLNPELHKHNLQFRPSMSTSVHFMKLKKFQREDLARAALHDGLILGLFTGLGKTICAYAWPLLKVGLLPPSPAETLRRTGNASSSGPKAAPSAGAPAGPEPPGEGRSVRFARRHPSSSSPVATSMPKSLTRAISTSASHPPSSTPRRASSNRPPSTAPPADASGPPATPHHLHPALPQRRLSVP